MKRGKKIVALILTLVMCLGMLPTAAFAVEEEKVNLSKEEMLARVAIAPVHKPQNFAEAVYATCTGDKPSSGFYDKDNLGAEREEVFQEIAALTERLISGQSSETEKAKVIYKWVRDNVEYDYEKPYIAYDGIYTFTRRRGVCEGYSRLCLLMLTLAGLPSAYVVNYNMYDDPHAWNGAYVDGQWLTFDATHSKWNDARPIDSVTCGYGRVIFGINKRGDEGCEMLGKGEPCSAVIEIPEGMTHVRDRGFEGGTMTSIIIPDSVISIGAKAFMDCKNLKDVTIPNSVSEIGYQTFLGCTNLTDVTIPDSVISIGESAFYKCTSLTSVSIPDSVTTIKNFAFCNCSSLTSLTISDSVTDIGRQAFSDCTSLTSVIIPSSVTSMGEFVFSDCTGLTSVTIDNGVPSIGAWAFNECYSLTNVVIPDSVTSIEECAFNSCINLTTVTIGSGVTSIGRQAFWCGGKNQINVYYGGSEAQWKAIDISYSNDYLTSATIHYNSAMPSQEPTPVKTAAENVQTVKVDGKDVSFAMYSPDNGGTNYVRLVDLAVALKGTAGQFNVGYDGRVLLTDGESYEGAASAAPFHGEMEYVTLDEPTYVNGVAKNMEAIRFEYNGGGYTYYKLRDLGKALGFNVGWDNVNQRVFLETDKAYTNAD